MISNLKSLRETKGLSQEVVAQTLGITRQTYSSIEKWNSELSLGQAVKLSALLDIPLEKLLDSDTTAQARDDIDRDKYKQIIMNCIHFGAAEDGKITKTKLAKLCYLVDFARFYDNLKPITWLEYRRIEQWPVPDAYFSTIDELEAEESIAIQKKGKAYMIENIAPPSTSKLNAEEIDLIHKICTKRQWYDTKAIVDFTHKQMPWLVCREKEIIPYEFITQEEPNNVY